MAPLSFKNATDAHPSLGVDIGASSIKGAIVDRATGRRLSARRSLVMPSVSTPPIVAELVSQLARDLGWAGPIGLSVPGVVRGGVISESSRLRIGWSNVDAARLFESAVSAPVRFVNDADAAGLAEVVLGDKRNHSGLTLALIFGARIGSALIHDGALVPNTEFGRVQLDGHSLYEKWASARARASERLSPHEWGKRVSRLVEYLEGLLQPDRILIGGRMLEDFDALNQCLDIRTPVAPMQLGADAAIVGAAVAAP